MAGLPFIETTVAFRGQSLLLKNVLLDTGSASTKQVGAPQSFADSE